MAEGINVLSLFDGISCGQIALERAGIKVNKYFASEIDKYAIQVTRHNYPNTIQIGDVREVIFNNGALKTRLGEFQTDVISLMMGGFPCQSFSISGKKLNFSDPRGMLFFELLRLLKEINPKYFLFENVTMKKECEDVITEHLGVSPILIDSADFSAQSRKRLYWTNIPFNLTGKFKNNLFLEDILDTDVDAEKLLLTNNYKLICQKTNESRIDVLKRNYRKKYKAKARKPVLVSEIVGDTPSGRSRQTDRLYSSLSKCPTLLANRSGDLKIDMGTENKAEWRNLSPVEAERLQTVTDNFTNCIPDNQRYKCLGNGWTVDVVAHIFSFYPKDLKK